MSAKPRKSAKVQSTGRTYPSVNAMLRGDAGLIGESAARIIDAMQEHMVTENLALLTALTDLLKACTAESYSTVCVPDRRVRNRAWRIARRYGAVLPGVPRSKGALL